MKTRVHVWPAAGGPAETFYDIDRLMLLADPVDIPLKAGEKVLLLNPMHLLACVVETGPAHEQEVPA